MKSKFSSMWRVSIALVLVLSFSLMAAPVSAAVSQPEVGVVPTTPNTGAIYTIEFTTTEDLEAGDGIVIEFPEGTTDIDTIVVGDVTVATGVNPASVANVDERLSLTLDALLEAGDITVVVGSTQFVTNPAVDDDYALDVYTSQEPTRVTSAEYMISPALTGVTQPTLNPDTAATASAYTIPFTTISELAIGEDIFIEFPVGTDISDVEEGDITVDGADPDPTVDHIHIDEQVLTINLGGNVLQAASTEVIIAAYIINPTTVDNPNPYEDEEGTVDDDTEWRLTVYTTKDRIPVVSDVYTLGGTLGTDVSQIAWLTVDEYVPNDAPSTAFVIQTQDEYGNPAEVEGAVIFELTASSGDFYSGSTCLRDDLIEEITITDSAVSASFYYKGATAGTVDITASELPAATPDWIDGTGQILVNPMLELWGGGAWIADYSTFADAIAAAVPYDTIKVDPSTYDGFGVSKSGITIESTGTTAETIIDALSSDYVVMVGAKVTIDGFTIKGDATSITQRGIRVRGSDVDGFVIQNNTFVDIRSDNILVTSYDGVITSGIIDNNTFIGTGLDSLAGRSGILVESYSSNAISGVEITNNTLSAFYGEDDETNAIGVAEEAGAVSEITVQDNIISDCYRGISLWGDVAGLTGDYAISNNTITGCLAGFKASGGHDVAFELVENTITGNTLYGVWLHDATPTDNLTIIKYNDLSGNGEYGIYNAWGESTQDVVARYNWWGDVTGPSTDPDPADPDATPTAYGEGDAISVEVLYSPWLAVSKSVCVPATSSRFAIEIPLTNVASYSAGTWSGGWNTFSTPIKLHGDGDTWGDIIALVDLQYAMVYGWDGTDWIAPFPSTTVITPLDAIFVQMKEEARLPILFSTQLSPAATKDLSAGWNLIGLASLDTLDRDEALASLGTVAGLDLKYSQVIDPISGAVLTDATDMLPGQGFWIFMKEAATLAGFSVTPQPWVD